MFCGKNVFTGLIDKLVLYPRSRNISHNKHLIFFLKNIANVIWIGTNLSELIFSNLIAFFGIIKGHSLRHPWFHHICLGVVLLLLYNHQHSNFPSIDVRTQCVWWDVQEKNHRLTAGALSFILLSRGACFRLKLGGFHW